MIFVCITVPNLIHLVFKKHANSSMLLCVGNGSAAALFRAAVLVDREVFQELRCGLDCRESRGGAFTKLLKSADRRTPENSRSATL